MRSFNLAAGARFRVPALLVAAATLAQAGDWQPLARTIANTSGQTLSLKGHWNFPILEMDLVYRIVSEGSAAAAPEGEPTPFPETPFSLPHGQTLQLYYRLINPDHLSGSALISVTDASGNLCANLNLEAKASAATLEPVKTEALGLPQSAPGQTGVKVDWSSPARVEFQLASGAQAAVETKAAAPAARVETMSPSGMVVVSPSSAFGGARAAVETQETAAAAGMESKSAPGAGLAAAPAAKILLIGEKPRTRVQCALDISDSGKKLVLTDRDGQSFAFEFTAVDDRMDGSKRPVDIIGDISGSMGSALAYDTKRPSAVPRSVAHELIYRAVRKRFPVGRNLVFDDTVQEWNMGGRLPKGGGTSLTRCLQFCDSSAVTVIFTDDKGSVLAKEALGEGCQKLIVPCLLTAFDIDVVYGDNPATSRDAEVQRGINSRYRLANGGVHTDPRFAPGFGVAMMGQRDALSLLRIDTAYDATGKISDQTEIVERIAMAIEKARTAKYWRITNPTNSEFVIHCPSGRTVCILPGTHQTVAPDPSDMKGFSISNVYIHSPAKKQ